MNPIITFVTFNSVKLLFCRKSEKTMENVTFILKETISLVTTPKRVQPTCTSSVFFPEWQRQFLSTFQPLIFYVRIPFGLLIPYSLISNGITLITFILLIKKWNNPLKYYYLAIATINFLQAVQSDCLKLSFSILLTTTIQIFGPQGRIAINVPSTHVVACKLIGYLDPALGNIYLSIMVVFSIYKMLIVVFPLKKQKVNNVFKLITLLIAIIIFGLIDSPNFFLYYMVYTPTGQGCLSL